jgi:hypothetical protein
MHFLIQLDDVCIIEKRVIRHAANLVDANLYFSSLAHVISSGISLDIPLGAVPVGTVEFVQAVMKVRGVAEPENITYPDKLKTRYFLRRIVTLSTYGKVTLIPEKFPISIDDIFVKPSHHVKLFTGSMLSELQSNEDNIVIPADCPIWACESVEFVSEWRYYVLHNKIIGASRYDDGDDMALRPDINMVLKATALMSEDLNCPAGYSLDFGVLSNGETALVEANDGWALGYYKAEPYPRNVFEGGCSAVDYARLLHARWIQLLKGIE